MRKSSSCSHGLGLQCLKDGQRMAQEVLSFRSTTYSAVLISAWLIPRPNPETWNVLSSCYPRDLSVYWYNSSNPENRVSSILTAFIHHDEVARPEMKSFCIGETNCLQDLEYQGKTFFAFYLYQILSNCVQLTSTVYVRVPNGIPSLCVAAKAETAPYKFVAKCVFRLEKTCLIASSLVVVSLRADFVPNFAHRITSGAIFIHAPPQTPTETNWRLMQGEGLSKDSLVSGRE